MQLNINTIFQLHLYITIVKKLYCGLHFFRYLPVVDLMHVEEDFFCSARYLNTSLKMAVIYVLFYLFLDRLHQTEDYVSSCHSHYYYVAQVGQSLCCLNNASDTFY